MQCGVVSCAADRVCMLLSAHRRLRCPAHVCTCLCACDGRCVLSQGVWCMCRSNVLHGARQRTVNVRWVRVRRAGLAVVRAPQEVLQVWGQGCWAAVG